jgi:hypothetical protein
LDYYLLSFRFRFLMINWQDVALRLGNLSVVFHRVKLPM